MKLSYSTLHAAIWRLALAIRADLAPWEYAAPGATIDRPDCIGRRDLDAARELIQAAEPWMRRELCRCFRTALGLRASGAMICPSSSSATNDFRTALGLRASGAMAPGGVA